MVALLFFALAGVFNAVCDTLQHHFETSIFDRLNPKFWDPNKSWLYTPLFKFRVFKWTIQTQYRPDAWHLSKSATIVCFACGAAFCKPLAFHIANIHLIVAGVWLVLVLGFVFMVVFNTFYNHLLRVKSRG